MDINDLIITEKILPEREGIYCEFPDEMHPLLREFLRSRNIAKLYIHQAEMFELAQAGTSVVITTATASGKTLGFLLPILQRILEDPLTRAVLIYPTKALAADQYRVIREIIAFFGEEKVSAGVYDGDTGSAERTRIRKQANIILTNPDMVNASFLPNHSKYGFDSIFANLKFMVVDELHSYRGAFGAHLANVMRRLNRICRFYGASPQFLCSSATIANPLELASNICGREFALVDEDGAPAPKRTYRFLQPPTIRGMNDKIYGRRPAAYVAAELLPSLVEENHHFIAFGKTRRGVEVILKEARDKMELSGFLGAGDSSMIAGYRGGYTPMERKKIEEKMIRGKLLGLVSTNALELGIDIGAIDTTVLVGYPGTRASFWQQTGRSGRNKTEAVNYLILENSASDQYLAIDPDWIFAGDCEHAIVDADNLLIQLSHIRAAAAELPLSLDDAALFPDLGEILPVLMKAGEIKMLNGRFAWDGEAFPAGDYSLRNMDRTRFKLILKEENREITEMDETRAYHEIYPGAVYIHDGVQFEVLSLDLVSRTAICAPFEGNYYTIPAGTEETGILRVHREEQQDLTEVRFGDIHMNEVISMFKKLQFHNHQNLGYVNFDVPLQKGYDTESTWISIPGNVVDVYRRLLVYGPNGYQVINNHFEGILNAIREAAMRVTMTAKDDIGAVMSTNALIPDGYEGEQVYLFIYDRYEGGLGYAEKIYDLMPQIIRQAIKMVKGCTCEDGCPACVGDYTLERSMVLWGLENLLEQSEPPIPVKIAPATEEVSVRMEFDFFELPQRWEEFCEQVIRGGESGGLFMKSTERVAIREHTLVFTVKNDFYVQWLKQPENSQSLINTIRFYALCPVDMKVAAQADTSSAAKEEQERKRSKLMRKYEERSGTERK